MKTTCLDCGALIDIEKVGGRCDSCLGGHMDSQKIDRGNYYRQYDKENRPSHHTFYNSKEWKITRKIILERDNHMCMDCLEQGDIQLAKLVHHIEELDSKGIGYEKRLEQDNLIVVCNSCHQRIHMRYELSEKDKENEQRRLRKIIEIRKE